MYIPISEIGSGSYGRAMLCKGEKGQLVVVKTVNLNMLSAKSCIAAQQEVKILACLRHPFIIRYRDSFVERNILNIVMDYANGGDLAGIIRRFRDSSSRIPESRLMAWFSQTALALGYLHEKHILHRDVKTSNIFISSSGRALLGDFGIAKVLDSPVAFAKTQIGKVVNLRSHFIFHFRYTAVSVPGALPKPSVQLGVRYMVSWLCTL